MNKEITIRVTEIRAIAAGLPNGGDISTLQTELVKLSAWTTRTLNYLAQTKQENENDTNNNRN